MLWAIWNGRDAMSSSSSVKTPIPPLPSTELSWADFVDPSYGPGLWCFFYLVPSWIHGLILFFFFVFVCNEIRRQTTKRSCVTQTRKKREPIDSLTPKKKKKVIDSKPFNGFCFIFLFEKSFNNRSNFD